ncbi:uncharacterized protein PV06_01500 [Exophiala oligosperma]|uniref:Xylanolytic transcriptional activator regulatory domain-containing protein n=1 Tax=Exophiala oligosperma TaxID=215243 RepID=A0A0D2EM48_9EURO|nr:uncharacterized protein PV06_01500 [Exophiala oligosperma]KIW48944.1 hypothetical protein PV06_01500 [Exophiala oligosperma]
MGFEAAEERVHTVFIVETEVPQYSKSPSNCIRATDSAQQDSIDTEEPVSTHLLEPDVLLEAQPETRVPDTSNSLGWDDGQTNSLSSAHDLHGLDWTRSIDDALIGTSDSVIDPSNQIPLVDFDWIFSINDEELPGAVTDFYTPQLHDPSPIRAKLQYANVDSEGCQTPVPASHPSTDLNSPGLREVWPIAWLEESAQSSGFPVLGEPELSNQKSANFYQIRPIDSNARESMIEVLSLPTKQTLWKPTSLANFLESRHIDQCIDMYFAHFDKTISFIHRPTFNPSEDLIVTLAMACIGLCYTGLRGANAFANLLSEYLRRLLIFMGESDPVFLRTEVYVKSQLLQCIHGVASGNKRLFEFSRSQRSFLVSQCKYMGLFANQPWFDNLQKPLEERWRSWAAQEARTRLAWAVFEFDMTGGHMHNTAPCLSLADVQLNLPCSIDHWTASSPQACAALTPWSASFPQGPSLHKVLLDIKTPHANLDVDDEPTDRHHKLIIAFHLVRDLYSISQLCGSPISSLTQGTVDFEKSRSNLLSTLESQLEPLSIQSMFKGPSELAILMHRTLLTRTAMVFGMGLVPTWLYSLLCEETSAQARGKLRAWTLDDPSRARRVMYQCAQILTAVRTFPCNLHYEPYSVFHAGLTIWSLIDILPGENIAGETRHLQIDRIQGDDREIDALIDDWIQNKTPAAVGIHEIPDLWGFESRRQLLYQISQMLRRMRAFGLARSFLNVILGLLKSSKNW